MLRNSINRKTNIIFSCIILLTIITIQINCIFTIDGKDDNYYTWVKIYGLLGWLLLFANVYFWYKIRREIFCIFNMFLIILYLFLYGHSLALAIGVDVSDHILSRDIHVSELMYSQMFTLLCLSAFMIGSILICKPKNSVSLGIFKFIDNNIKLETLKKTGLIIFFLSAPAFLYDIIRKTIIVIEGGYGALYGYDGFGGTYIKNSLFDIITMSIAKYFFVSLICLLIAYSKNKLKRKIILIIMYSYVIISLFNGGRGGAIALVIIIICIKHYCIRPINIKRLLTLIIAVYILSSIIIAVAMTRGLTDNKVNSFLNILLETLTKENPIILVILEMGYSMHPLTMVMDIFPSEYNFYFGKSYYLAISTIFPTRFIPQNIFNYVEGSNWLMKTMKMSYGPGFSLAADAYRNFGWSGFPVFIGFGMLYGKVFSLIDRNTIKTKPYILCLVMIFANFTIMCPRFDNIYILRSFFHYILPTYIFMKFLDKTKTINNKYKC